MVAFLLSRKMNQTRAGKHFSGVEMVAVHVKDGAFLWLMGPLVPEALFLMK
jgi:hypothetical protein